MTVGGAAAASGMVLRLGDGRPTDESSNPTVSGSENEQVPRHSDTRPMRSLSAGSVEDSSSASFQPSRRSNPHDGIPPVEGLRMRQVFDHEPVMEAEVVALFAPVPAGVVIDATVGAGGHAGAILAAHPHLRVLGLDRDPDAVEAATQRLSAFGDRARVRHAPFNRLAQEMEEGADGSTDQVTGVLFDLGVSSPQLDTGERGFSYRHDGPVDMRMDPTTGPSGSDVVNTWPLDDWAGCSPPTGRVGSPCGSPGPWWRRGPSPVRASWPRWFGPPFPPPPDGPGATRPDGCSRPSGSPSTTSSINWPKRFPPPSTSWPPGAGAWPSRTTRARTGS